MVSLIRVATCKLETEAMWYKSPMCNILEVFGKKRTRVLLSET